MQPDMSLSCSQSVPVVGDIGLFGTHLWTDLSLETRKSSKLDGLISQIATPLYYNLVNIGQIFRSI